MYKTILIAILTLVSLCVHAQSFNKDSLAKHGITKILRYEIDSAGNKNLASTYVIDKRGLFTSEMSNDLKYGGTKFIHYDYNANGKVIKRTVHSVRISNKGSSNEKTDTLDYEETYQYDNNNMLQSSDLKSSSGYIHQSIFNKKGKSISKEYKGSKCFSKEIRYTKNDIHYIVYTDYSPVTRLLRKSKTILETKRNARGDKTDEHFKITLYFKNILKRRLSISYDSKISNYYDQHFLIKTIQTGPEGHRASLYKKTSIELAEVVTIENRYEYLTD